jgi:tRNA(fMet)-specific endonuclease VapC
VCTSIIVACELRFGAAKSLSPRIVKNVETILANIEIRHLASGVDRHYGAIRAALERKGQPIGANDLLIAAHALSEKMILVTDNVREFKRVAGLRIENWLDTTRA